eukprot:242530-Prorocentrum_minimum.AAC.2
MCSVSFSKVPHVLQERAGQQESQRGLYTDRRMHKPSFCATHFNRFPTLGLDGSIALVRIKVPSHIRWGRGSTRVSLAHAIANNG